MVYIKNKIAYSISSILLCLPLIASAGHSDSSQLSESQEIKDYKFDTVKVKAAADAFHFLRSFVDLFYLTYKANETNLPEISNLTQIHGWCVGDAHPENFGVMLQQNNKPLFTMNDMDDSGPCPVALDLIRLLVSSSLYNKDTDLNKTVDAYLTGLKNDDYKEPDEVHEIMKYAKEIGTQPNDKKVKGNIIVRDEQMKEVTPEEKAQITEALKSYNEILPTEPNILDAVSTSKVGGGSGGLLRYEVLIVNKNGEPLHLEFKEEVTPSIYPVADSIPNTTKRIANTILYAQGENASNLYKVVKIKMETGKIKEMLVRPRFAGNVGIALKNPKKLNVEDIIQFEETVRFEAYTLGLIHSHSLSDDEEKSLKKLIKAVPDKAWKNEIGLITNYFNKKFKEVKKTN